MMDNPAGSQAPGGTKTIGQAGTVLVFRLPYAPDLTLSEWLSQNSMPCCKKKQDELSFLCDRSGIRYSLLFKPKAM
ncbi:hypothetical protein [Acetobacter tropicalis]|nr:hypothetical protein [Acetobacter tropicalis]